MNAKRKGVCSKFSLSDKSIERYFKVENSDLQEKNNTLQKIQNLSAEGILDYVNTKYNPVDLISRGVNLCDLKGKYCLKAT